MLIRVPVSVFDEWVDTRPEFCEIEIPDLEEFRQAVIKRAAAVKDLKAYKISIWDGVDRFYEEDSDVDDTEGNTGDAYKECDDFRVECTTLNVYTDSICWSGRIKHTEIRWETAEIDLALLEELNNEAVLDMLEKGAETSEAVGLADHVVNILVSGNMEDDYWQEFLEERVDGEHTPLVEEERA